MMAMRDPSMAHANSEFNIFLFSLLPGSNEEAEASFKKLQKGVKGFVKKIKRGFEKAGSFSLPRSTSNDTTEDDANGLEISSEDESVWSDEDIYYPSARTLTQSDAAETPVVRKNRRCRTITAKADADTPWSAASRRARRTKSWHTPRVSWIDIDSDSDDDMTSAEDTLSRHRRQKPLPRSRSLHALLFGVEGNSEEEASKNEVTFEIGSSDDDTVLMDTVDSEHLDAYQQNRSPCQLLVLDSNVKDAKKPTSPLGTLGAALQANEVAA